MKFSRCYKDSADPGLQQGMCQHRGHQPVYRLGVGQHDGGRSIGHNEVRVNLGRFREALVAGSDREQILIDDRLGGAAPLDLVPQHVVERRMVTSDERATWGGK